MECRELFARLSEYLDGELPPGLCDEIHRHLQACTPCEAFAATLRRTIDLCRALPAAPLDEHLRAELKALLARAKHR